LRKDLLEAAVSIPFLKVTGGGNDFVLLDNRNGRLAGDLSELVRRISHRGLGVGADGVILVEWSQRADLAMVYFNSDGGAAALCGNGLRCLARWAATCGVFPSPLLVETGAGLLEANGREEPPWIKLPLGKPDPEPVLLDVEGRKVEGIRVMAGVPHLVVAVEDLYEPRLMEEAPLLRMHPDLGPEGANVDFFVAREDGLLDLRYYERGVEAETLSSGTGTIAVALAARMLGRAGDTVECRNTLGLQSRVTFEEGAEGTSAVLAGDARIVFQGRLRRELLEMPFPSEAADGKEGSAA